MNKGLLKEFNKKYYNSKTSDDEIESFILGLHKKDRAVISADIVARKPWDITSLTTVLMFLIFLILPIGFLTIGILNALKGNPLNNIHVPDYVLFFLDLFLAPLGFGVTCAIVYVMVTGFAFLLPGMYNKETDDTFLASYMNSSKVVRFNGKMYEIVDYGDDIRINQTSSPGMGALALNAIKAVIYQFKKVRSFKALEQQIVSSEELTETYSNLNIKDALEKKRNKKVIKMLRINLVIVGLIFCLTCIYVPISIFLAILL